MGVYSWICGKSMLHRFKKILHIFSGGKSVDFSDNYSRTRGHKRTKAVKFTPKNLLESLYESVSLLHPHSQFSKNIFLYLFLWM